MAQHIYTQNRHTVQEVLDYMDCSLCHYLKYIEQAPPADDFLATHQSIASKEALDDVYNYYFSQHQRKRPPSLKTLYDKYYTAYLDKTGEPDQGSILTRDVDKTTEAARQKSRRFITQGYETIRKFYGIHAKQKQAVLAVNHPYTIYLADMTIEGTYGLIREVPNEDIQQNQIELVVHESTKRKPTEDQLARDLNLTAMAYAFYHEFNIFPERFLVHYVNREEVYTITRGANDFQRMMQTFKAFEQSLMHVPPHPRPGAHRIASPYKELCDNFVF